MSTPRVTQADKNFLLDISAGASAILMKYFGNKLKSSTKADLTIVTEADLASEKYILENIAKYYPDDLFLAEESGWSSQTRQPGKYIWVIDPLDGTTNFFNGYPMFAVSIGRALIKDDGCFEVVLGGIVDPTLGLTYMAAQGMGAYCGDKKLHISGPTQLEQAFLVTGIAFNKLTDLDRDLNVITKVLRQFRNLRRDGSAALDLARVAAGVYDGFWEFGLSPWDVAAGSLLVTEAGGVVVNYASPLDRPFDITGTGLVAGPHAIVEILSQFIAQC